MSPEPRRGFFRNWPLKLAALLLSGLLYLAVAAQRQVTQEVVMRLDVRVPPGRMLLSPAGTDTVVLRGKIAELLRLRSIHRVIELAVPETLSTASWITTLPTSSVKIPEGSNVEVAEFRPREVVIQLDSVGSKEVPVAARVTVTADSGQALDGGLQITPNVVRLVGPDRLLATIEAVATEPTTLNAVRGQFSRLVPLDTSALGVIRIARKQVLISGNTTPVFERAFNLMPIESGAGPLSGYELRPAHVTVLVRGSDAALQGLSKDSIRVIVHLGGPVNDSATVRLTVLAPKGVTARAAPDSVLIVRRRSGRG
jgi:hypothetical protein